MDSKKYRGLGRLSDHVVRQLRKRIASGDCPVGNRLPTVRALCREFEVSHPTIRRAISFLVEEGLVSTRQGSGTYVTGLPETRIARDTVSVMSTINNQVLMEIQATLLKKKLLAAYYFQSSNKWEPASERMFLRNVLQQQHKGLLAYCSPIEPLNDDLLAELHAAGTNVVHIMPYRLAEPSENFVMLDFSRAGLLAASALMLSGYEKVILVDANLQSPANQMTLRGVARALGNNDLEAVEKENAYKYPVNVENSKPARAALMKFIHDLKPNTGLIANCPRYAQWIFQLLKENRRSVPDDIGVIIIDMGENPTLPNSADTLLLPFGDCLKRSLEVVLAAEPPEVREWLPPVWLRAGATTRVPLRGGNDSSLRGVS